MNTNPGLSSSVVFVCVRVLHSYSQASADGPMILLYSQ